jgi:hypothetical protein
MLKGNINLKSERKIWVPYKGAFEVEIRHIPRDHSRQISQACQKREWDVDTAQYLTALDKEKFYDVLSREVLTNWRGLTPDVLRMLVDMKKYPESEVPYSPEDAAELLQRVEGFDVWVQNIARNLDHYEADRRAGETKNS